MNRKHAKMCLDCEEIYNIYEHDSCPICTSQKFWMIGNWIAPIELNPKERKTDAKNCDDCDPPRNSHLASSNLS